MGVDPGEAAEVEVVAGAGDGDVGEAGVGVADGFGDGASLGVVLVGVLGWWEVVADLDGGPFAAFGGVGGGDGHVGVLFVGEMVDCGEDGVGAVGVDEVDEGLEVASGGVVCGVVLQLAPGREEDEFGVGGAAAVFEVAGREGQCGQLLSSSGESLRV
jgi:hypothetical protein